MKYPVRSKSIIIFCSIILLILSSCITWKKAGQPTQSVTRVTDTVRIQNGSLVYALPRTIFTVRVGLQHNVIIPGPYAAYAGDMLGLKNVPGKREEHWSINSVSVSSHEEADPSEYYIIHAKGEFLSNALALKKEGLILDLNPVDNNLDESLIIRHEINANHFLSPDLGSDEYYQVETDTAFRRVKVDSSFIRIPYTVEKKKILSADQLAEKAARRLMEIRDGKVAVLTGEANVFPQNDAAINELNRMEKEYTELFTGKVISEVCYYTVQLVPEKESAGKEIILFRLSEADGPGSSSGKSGIPVIAKIIPEQKTRDITIIESEPSASNSSVSDKLIYRIPDIAEVNISQQGKTLYNSRKIIYQLGEVMQLPGNYVIGK